MLARPVDSSGDILPVLAPSDLLSGPAAAAAGLRDHLNLFPGDWWENPSRGNEILDLLISSHGAASEAQTLATALVSHILAFPGIQSVTDVQTDLRGHTFSFSCLARTESGETFPLHFDNA